jgi:inorganic pyrophosphatase
MALSCSGGAATNPSASTAGSQTDEAGDDDLYAHGGELNFMTDIEPRNQDGSVNVVIEIPAGTTAKWEVTPHDGRLVWELEGGRPRVVRYLGYPGNYGMIPRTMLPEEAGGDGAPLDALVLGEAVPRGSVVRTKVIGVLRLLDGGEQDDKLIAVRQQTPFYEFDGLRALAEELPGVELIVETWFTNYKGPGRLESLGFEDATTALAILGSAERAYQSMAGRQPSATVEGER